SQIEFLETFQVALRSAAWEIVRVILEQERARRLADAVSAAFDAAARPPVTPPASINTPPPASAVVQPSIPAAPSPSSPALAAPSTVVMPSASPTDEARPEHGRIRGVVKCFFFQAEDGIRYLTVTGVQTCALPI